MATARRNGHSDRGRVFERAPERACIGLRVSTTKQEVRSQRLAVERYCQAKRWQVVERHEEVVSGAAPGRAVPQKILDAARKGAFDVVVCFRTDRAFRTAGRAAVFIDELGEMGAYFVGLEDGIDTSSPMGSAMAKVASVFAELERHGIKARICAGLDAALTEGKRVGRARWAPEVDVRRLVKFRKQGASWTELADLFSSAKARISPATVRRRYLEAITPGPDPRKVSSLRRKGASWSEIAELLDTTPTRAAQLGREAA